MSAAITNDEDLVEATPSYAHLWSGTSKPDPGRETRRNRAARILSEVLIGVQHGMVPSAMFSQADLEIAFAGRMQELVQLEAIALPRAQAAAAAQQGAAASTALSEEIVRVMRELQEEERLQKLAVLRQKATAIARQRLGLDSKT